MSEGNSLELLIDSAIDISHNSHFLLKILVKSDAIYIAGTTDYADSGLSHGQRTYDFFVSKFNKDGTYFQISDNGVFQKDFGDTDKVTVLEIQDDGKILVAGINWLDFATDAIVMRINVDGSIDESFGIDGSSSVSKFAPMNNHLNFDDRGNEEGTDIYVDSSGNIFFRF